MPEVALRPCEIVGQLAIFDNPDIECGDKVLKLCLHSDLPQDPIQYSYSPDHDACYYQTLNTGRVYKVDPLTDDNLPDNDSLWWDMSADCPEFNRDNTGQGGLRSIAFHPDFAVGGAAGEGKFYVSVMLDRPANIAGFNYLGADTSSGTTYDSAVVEFCVDPNTGLPDPTSKRELFRISLPATSNARHPIKQIAFGPDGFLYIAHGDGGLTGPTQSGQDLQSGLGKILRIDPIGANPGDYTPAGASIAGALPEIWAYGFRNPHNFSWGPDGQMIIADIGQDNIEEINLAKAGGNFGWPLFEGPFSFSGVIDQPYGLDLGGVSLPPDNVSGFCFPSTMIDHRDGGFLAITGGHVVSNGSELDGCYFFGDFGTLGHVWTVPYADLASQTVQAESPYELTYATPERVKLEVDGVIHDTVASALGLPTNRSDLRFGIGNDGEIYLTSKIAGQSWLVKNSLPPDHPAGEPPEPKVIVTEADAGATEVGGNPITQFAVPGNDVFANSRSGDQQVLGGADCNLVPLYNRTTDEWCFADDELPAIPRVDGKTRIDTWAWSPDPTKFQVLEDDGTTVSIQQLDLSGNVQWDTPLPGPTMPHPSGTGTVTLDSYIIGRCSGDAIQYVLGNWTDAGIDHTYVIPYDATTGVLLNQGWWVENASGGLTADPQNNWCGLNGYYFDFGPSTYWVDWSGNPATLTQIEPSGATWTHASIGGDYLIYGDNTQALVQILEYAGGAQNSPTVKCTFPMAQFLPYFSTPGIVAGNINYVHAEMLPNGLAVFNLKLIGAGAQESVIVIADANTCTHKLAVDGITEQVGTDFNSGAHPSMCINAAGDAVLTWQGIDPTTGDIVQWMTTSELP